MKREILEKGGGETLSPEENSVEASKQARRAVACKSCHALKVRCTPHDELDPMGPCSRCRKVDRKCEIEVVPRKKKRKKDCERIEDLENQVRVLASKLGDSAAKQPIPLELPLGLLTLYPSVAVDPQLLSGEPATISASKRTQLEGELKFVTLFQLARFPSIALDVTSLADRRIALLSQERHPDPIDSGLLTLAEAEERLRIYIEEVYVRYSFVHVTSDLAALRTNEPFLFLAVLNTVTMLTQKARDDTDILLENLCMQALTTQVLVVGNKSLELLKCLLLLCVWNNAPELFHQRRYHLVNSLCVSMVQDLGLSGRPYYFFNREEGAVVRTMAILDPKNLECQKMVLSVYFVSVCNALFMRRVIAVRWIAYFDECCKSLEATADARLCGVAMFARLIHQLERIYFTIHSPEDHIPFDVTSFRCRYLVNNLQEELETIKKAIDPTDDELLSFYYSVEAYLHEPAVDTLEPAQLSSTLVKAAVARCSHSCMLSLKYCAQLTPLALSRMPLFYCTRILYTAGMLLRLRYMAVTMDRTDMGIIPQDMLLLLQQVSRIIDLSVQTYPLHNFLRKMRLVLALFIQTYASQIKALLGRGKPEKVPASKPLASTTLAPMVQASMAQAPNAPNSQILAGRIPPVAVPPYGTFQQPFDQPSEPHWLGEVPARRGQGESESARRLAPRGSASAGLDILSLVAHTKARSPVPFGLLGSLAPFSPAVATPPFPLQREVLPTSQGVSPSSAYPLIPTPNYSEILADPNSLEMSYWALNDEFWTDLVKSNFEVPSFDP